VPCLCRVFWVILFLASNLTCRKKCRGWSEKSMNEWVV